MTESPSVHHASNRSSKYSKQDDLSLESPRHRDEQIANTSGPPEEEIVNNEQLDDQALIEKEYLELKKNVKIPYLEPLNPDDERYTLVLDLDETLIHFEIDEDVPEQEEPGYYLIRPGAIKFLQELSKFYEIIVFTAAMPDVSYFLVNLFL